MPTVYHIPICPFSQRLEVLLELKGLRDQIRFEVVDITKPRDPELLRKSDGTTALPMLEDDQGRILKESMVILRYLESLFPDPPVRRRDAYEHAVEDMMTLMEGDFTAAGYILVLNQDPAKREALTERLLSIYRKLNAFLVKHNPDGTYLFDEFGYAEVVYTPMFMRFWFLEYYEDFDLPPGEDYDRVRKWREACLAHPAAQQVTEEEIVKLYYDYAKGKGNGALVEGRERSSFVFSPPWKNRPRPPKDKYGYSASDQELGLK